MPNDKWGERPIVVAVKKASAQVDKAGPQFTCFPGTRVQILTLQQVGGTGKIVKKQLRDDYAAGKLR